jgi:hypothetical protein
MEVGESVSPSEFVNQSEDVHDEKTCPWCQPKQKQGKAKKIPKTSPDEDVVGAIPPNDGGELGKALEAAGQKAPRDSIEVTYQRGTDIRFMSGKKVKGKTVKRLKALAVYEKTEDEETEEYDLQYAPHHLIPGNASLKGSAVVPFMGDDDTIADYVAEGTASKIKEGRSIGYDVNAADNGQWLPSPYALSMRNEWPSEKDVEVVKKRKGIDLGPVTEAFKQAYVAAAIEESGAQFHMSHEPYSEKVQEILKAVGARLKLLSDGSHCPIAKKSKDKDGKFDPPYGLVARLNVLSDNMRRLVTGSLWRPPLYTDGRTEAYAADLKQAKKNKKGDIRKVL